MINFSDANKTKLMDDFGIFGERTKTKAAFSRPTSMIGYTIVAIPVGATKLITGIVYTAMQAFRALSELFTTKKADRTAFREMKFGLALIGKALLQIIPVMNAFAKLYQIHCFKKDTIATLKKAIAPTVESANNVKETLGNADSKLFTSAINHTTSLIEKAEKNNALNPETAKEQIEKNIAALNKATVLAAQPHSQGFATKFAAALEDALPSTNGEVSTLNSKFKITEDYKK